MTDKAELLKMLPADILPKIAAIQGDKTLDDITRHDKLMELLVTLGPEIHAKIEALPLPAFFDQLPEDLKAKVKAIKADTTLSFPDRVNKYKELLKDLPADIKEKLKAPQQ